MSSVLTDQEIKRASSVNRMGWALIAAGFAIAYGHQMWLTEMIELAVQSAAEAAGTLLVLTFISWLFTRNENRMTKAYGRLTCGALLCIIVAYGIYSKTAERNAEIVYLRESDSLRTEYKDKFAAFLQRYNRTNFSEVLTPQAVTTKEGIAMGRQALVQFRGLLAERRGLLKSYMAEAERLVDAMPSDDTARSSISSAIVDKHAVTWRAYDELDKAETAFADIVEQILAWSEKQGKQLTVEDGQLRFVSHEQATELQSYLDALAAAEKSTINARKEVAQLQADRDRARVQAEQAMEQLSPTR